MMAAEQNRLKAKWASLAKREKIIVMATMLIAFAALVELGISGLSGKAPVTGTNSLEASQAELVSLGKQRVQMNSELEAARPHEANQGIVLKKNEEALKDHLVWSESNAKQWFGEMVGLFGLGLGNLSVMSAGDAAVEYPGLFRHKIEFEAIGSWETVVKALNGSVRDPAVSVDQMDVTQNEAGQLVVKTRLSVLSSQKNWSNIERRLIDGEVVK